MNKPQSNSAQQSGQTTQTQQNPKLDSARPTPKLKPDFSHRLPEHLQEATPLSLVDTIDTMSRQAISVLNMLAGHFTGETDGVSDEIVFWSIESAIATIRDIKAVVDAYHVAMKGGAE